MAVVDKIPIKRTQEYVIFDDKPRVRRCYGPHNPHYFSRDDRDFFPINLGQLDTGAASSIGNIYLKDQNVRSFGIRKDLKSDRLFGIRPDNAQDGSIQFQISPGDLTVDGVSERLRPAKADFESSVMFRFGQFRVSQTRQGARLYLPYDGSFGSFSLSINLHLDGLEVIHRQDIDEYWFFRQDNGELFCRLRKPDIYTTDGANPIWSESELEPKEVISHDLVLNGDGSFTYTKYSNQPLLGLGLPTSLIDGDFYYGDTADGYVHHSVSDDWSATRSAATGIGYNDSYSRYAGAIYVSQVPYIRRVFLLIDTSGVGTVDTAVLGVYGYSANSGDAMAMKGTQSTTLSTADYDAFTGSSYGAFSAWSTSSYNTLSITAGDVVDGNTKICVRNKTYDYDDGGLPDSAYQCGCWFADEEGTVEDPYLEITEESGPAIPVLIHHYKQIGGL